MPTNEREPLAGGSLGKLAGRAKEMAGNLLGRRDLGREGRLQRVGAEAEERAAAKTEVADRKAEEADVAERRAANEAERREVEVAAVEMAAEDRVEARQSDKERQAARAEAAADRLDPKEES
jgi:uncharacterized protein YjbJ (UPF0337 family)